MSLVQNVQNRRKISLKSYLAVYTLTLFLPTYFFSVSSETRVKIEPEETPEEVEVEVDVQEESHSYNGVRVRASSKVICQVWPLTYFYLQLACLVKIQIIDLPGWESMPFHGGGH